MRFREEILKRPRVRRDKATGKPVTCGLSPCWYGRWKDRDGRWKWHKLYTDKRASASRWEAFKTEQERRHAGVITATMDHAAVPLSQHAADYLADLKRGNANADHYRIASWMLNRLIDLGGWKRLSDVTADSLRGIIDRLQKDGATTSYANKYVSRAKAFMHWLKRNDRIESFPLAGVKRANEQKAEKRRARRPLTDPQATALLAAAPEERRRKYLFALLTGLRRSELADLRWGDLRLNSPVPFIQLREDQTKNGKADALPLHPALVRELAALRRRGDDVPVLGSMPDMKSMAKDLLAAGIAHKDEEGRIVIADAKGRRADFHALRHTFATNLGRTGCSDTTKRALMRHADQTVTDGYSHARLAELREAVERLPDLTPAAAAAVATGTDCQNAAAVWSHTGHGAFPAMPGVALGVTTDPTRPPTLAHGQTPENTGIFASWHGDARPDLIGVGTADIVSETGRSTQVD